MSARQLKIEDLSLTVVDPNSPIPLYYQVEADLRAMLTSSRIEPGDLLPTEIELSRAYNVGRQTVRAALARLAADSLIVRRAGHGTVVRPSRDRRRFSLAHSFTEQMRLMGVTPRTIVLSQVSSVIDENAPPALKGSIGASCLILERLRLGDDEPIGLQRAIVMTSHTPELETYDFGSRSLYALLAERYQLVIAEIAHSITAVASDTRQAELLRVDAGVPLLLVNTVAYLDTGDAIEVTTSHYRADKYEYTTTHAI